MTKRTAATTLAALSLIAMSAPIALAEDTTRPDPPPPAVRQLKLDSAQVADGPLRFGARPLRAVRAAASSAAANADCAISAAQATALTLAPTWPETAGGLPDAPSPMTLSRYDNQTSLYAPRSSSGVFFNPGVGPWQLDSAGLGASASAYDAIDVSRAARTVAPYIVGRYCAEVGTGADSPAARDAAWSDWYACADGACEDTYQRALEGVRPVRDVGRYGGAEPRRCRYLGETYRCLYVDPGEAQGATWWARSGGGPAPVPAPFYVFTNEFQDITYEVRFWLPADTGLRGQISASRPLGHNARDVLYWETSPGMCDTTTDRGSC